MILKKLTKLFSLTTLGVAPLVTAIACGNGNSPSKGRDISSVKSVLGSFKDGTTIKDYTSLKDMKGQGSSSVLPITEKITGILENFQYDGTGSGDGLKVGKQLGGGTGIANKEFGMTSSLKHPDNASEWSNVRTVTFAIDAIGIATHLPSDVKIKDDAQPIFNIQELAKLYDKETSTTTTWEKLLENEDTNSKGLSKTPLPLGREGGKSKSGTADGFWHILKKNLPTGSTADENHENLVANGGKTTGEANSVALNVLKQNEGSITYLSLGLSLEDKDANKKDGFWIASIKKDSETWIPTLEKAKSGDYKWRRPFNIIYSVNNDKSRKFVQFLLQTEVAKIIVDKGFVPLTKAQIESQFGSSELAKVIEDLKKPDTEKITSQTGKTVADAILGLEI